MDRRQLQLIGALLLPLMAAGAQAEVYKWTDAQGKVHFGDKAPDGAGATVATPRNGSVAEHQDLALSITEHGRPLPPDIRTRAEEGIHGVVRVYRKVFGLDLRKTVVVDAHVFDDQTALRTWVQANTGKPAPNLLGVYLIEKRLVGVANIDGNPEETLKTLIHEANHVILAQLSPTSPLWLHEGLSQYFEGIDTTGEGIVVHPDLNNDKMVRYLMANGKLIQLHDYLAIPARRWQEIAHGQGNPMPYVIAWSLTSFMMSKPFKRQLLGGMMQDLEKVHIPPDLDAFVRRYPGGPAVLEYDWYKWAMEAPVTQTLE